MWASSVPWFGYLAFLVPVQLCWFELVNRDIVSFGTKGNLEELWFLFHDVKWLFVPAMEGGVPGIMPNEDVVNVI